MRSVQLEQLQENLGHIEEKFGYSFKNKDLLIAAFTHSSYLNERKGRGLMHNERLEFLGDSVLGMIVSEYLYQRLPDQPEGPLSQIRSRLVDATSCARFLQKLGVVDAILLGRGERITTGSGQGKLTIQADAFEALIGALYLDGGFAVTKTFILSHFTQMMEEVMKQPSANYKAQLQDFSQRKFQKPPSYQVVEQGGPEHAKTFHVVVFIDGKESGRGTGYSKKEAEQGAAQDALSKMGHL